MAALATSYAILADLLDYPEKGFGARAARCFGELEERRDATLPLLAPFRKVAESFTLEDLQELYTRTFDINPVCTLEVGWHVYGEDYARGEFLVKMREKLREHNIPESCELPDHLSHVLALLWRLEAPEADDLAARYVLPALAKMMEGLGGATNPYEALLQAIARGVRTHHDVEIVEPRQRRGDPPGWSARLPMLDPADQDGNPSGRGGCNGAR
jgi:nitrate reductase delta subunit